MDIQFLQPVLNEDDIQEAVRVMRSGWLVLGKETELFEQAFAEYMGSPYGIFTNSCTCALEILCMYAGFQEGDEVITTPLTYVSSVNPILHSGATPVFVDVDEGTGLINLDQVEAAITPKTKGIIPVHLYGLMADMNRLAAIAEKHKLIVIEDAAHAIEAERDGVRPGQKSLGAAFSFHVAKNMTAGTGGALVTHHAKLADAGILMRRDGVRNGPTERYMELLGHKFLGTDYQAAILRNQLKRIDALWEKRKACYDRYAAAFDGAGIAYSTTLPNVRHGHHMIILWVDPTKRNDIREQLFKNGIQTSVHYNPVHLEPYYRERFGYTEGMFPVAEKLGHGAITLPLYPSMTEEQQDYVIQHVIEAFNA